MRPFVAPSLLAADFTRLPDEIGMFNGSEADWLHLDVMDGRFVPNITFGMFVIAAINKMTDKPLDVHLMIAEPERYIEQFRKAGADTITVHYEACVHLHRTLQQIRATGARAGVALNPHTPVSVLEDILENVELVCLMSVNPGFGGQQFIQHTYKKIIRLREMAEQHNHDLLIEVDGGVGLNNARSLVSAGADVLVAGSSVFGAAHPAEVIHQLKAAGRPAIEV